MWASQFRLYRHKSPVWSGAADAFEDGESIFKSLILGRSAVSVIRMFAQLTYQLASADHFCQRFERTRGDGRSRRPLQFVIMALIGVMRIRPCISRNRANACIIYFNGLREISLGVFGATSFANRLDAETNCFFVV